MMTNLIIPSLTWNVCQHQNICRYHGKNINWVKRNIFHHLQDKKQQSGMPLKQEYFGTKEMLKEPKVGQNGKEKTYHANLVGKFFRAWLERVGTRGNIVQQTAEPLLIENVRNLSHKQDVWCLTVPGVHHFSLSNGAIVHNCADSYTYGAVAWRNQFTRPEQNEPRKYEMAIR
jgi:hypothetical protein